MIYLTGYKLIGKNPLRQLSIDLYRMIIGFAGAGFFILLWKKVWELTGKRPFSVLQTLGQNSLALYMISGEISLIAGMKLRPFLFQSHHVVTLLLDSKIIWRELGPSPFLYN